MRRGLVDFVGVWSGMKSSANGSRGWVDLSATAFWRVEEWSQGERVWSREREVVHKCAICLRCFCCWNLQLSWSVGGGEGTFAGIVGDFGWNCWTKGRVQGILEFLCISRINFLRDLFVAARRNWWVVSSIFECGQQGLLVYCLIVVVSACNAAYYDVAKQKENWSTIESCCLLLATVKGTKSNFVSVVYWWCAS